MAKIRISLKDPETRAVWESALQAKREVDSWPAWKRGETEKPLITIRGGGLCGRHRVRSVARYPAPSDSHQDSGLGFRPFQRGWLR